MLVLSRKSKDTIDLPELGVSIEILKVKGKTVRVGIEAPEDIAILRGEIGEESYTTDVNAKARRTKEHELRNVVNGYNLAIAYAKQLIEMGQTEIAAEKLGQMLEKIEAGDDEKRQPTALVVEDADNEREMLAGFLRLQGYQVKAVSDGVEAIEWLQQ